MEITVPKEYIDQFTNTPEMPPEQVPATGTDKVLLDVVEKTLEFGYAEFDRWAKDQGLTGLGKIEPEQVTKLSVIVAEKRIPKHLLENSPEIALLTVLGGIASANLIQYKKLQNKQAKASKKSEPGNE